MWLDSRCWICVTVSVDIEILGGRSVWLCKWIGGQWVVDLCGCVV